MFIIGISVFTISYFFVAQLLIVTGDSMFPTFSDGEQLLAEKVSIKTKPLERGEIIIFKSPNEPERLLIKRVIGLPNETIKIEGGKIFINDMELVEPYLTQGTTTEEGKIIGGDIPYQIKPGTYILMGDNRDNSTDSRAYGSVPEDLIIGRGVLVYYPLDNIRIID